MVLPMPKLSPEMQVGTISRWLKSTGDRVRRYDLLCEVETTQLVEEAYRMGDFAGAVTLLIESQEDGILARRLAPEGASLPVGSPIAVLVERESGAQSDGSEPDSSDCSDSSAADGAPGAEPSALRRARGYEPPTTDVYDGGQPRVRVLEWQSYLKDSKEPSGCRKCMG